MTRTIQILRGTEAQNDAFTGAVGELTMDTTNNEIRIHDGSTVGGHKIGSGSGLNVGDIFLTMRNDNELNGAVETDGTTYNTTDFTGAHSIGQLLADGKVPFVSMAVYDSTVAAQGWCDKFGWDGAGNIQFKVPTLNAYIWQKLQIGVAGNGYAIGLTNGSNDRTLQDWASGTNFPFIGGQDRPVGLLPQPGVGNNAGTGNVLGVSTDSTKSGMVVGSSSDVSQQRCMVQLATGATDEALETCTAVTAQVAANTAAIAGADYVVESQLPTAQNNYTWYRKYKSGWVEQGGYRTGSTQDYSVTLPIAMNDAYYTITALPDNYTGVAGAFAMVGQNSQTTTGFVLVVNFYGSQPSQKRIRWFVAGMAAN